MKTRFKNRSIKNKEQSENRVCQKKINININIEIVDQIYNKRLKKYLDYCWIQ